MTRRICIAICAAIFLIGVIMVLNRNPHISIGDVSISCDGTETDLEGYKVSRVKNDTTKFYDDTPNMMGLVDDMTTFEQKVEKNVTEDTVTIDTNMSVGFSGRFTNVTYTVYDLEGKQITSPDTQLKLPTDNIEGCIVQVLVDWGYEENYIESEYFFKVSYITK